MRVLCCGSRQWRDLHTIRYVLEQLQEQESALIVVHGGARGADLLAGQAARELGLIQEIHEPAYASYPREDRWRAPLQRNVEMLTSGIDLVVAFRGEGKSSGTDYTVREARKREIPVQLYTTNGVRSQ